MITIIKRILAIILCIVLAGGIYYAYKTYNEKEAEKAKELRQISALIPPLEEKINSLTAERAQVEKDYLGQMTYASTQEFIFTECPAELYKDVYPVMQEYGYTGVIALSQTELFNQFGKINYTQLREMVNAGWTVCIAWDGVSDLGNYLDSVIHNLVVFSFEVPTAVYFPENTYRTEYDSVLAEHDITTVIHHGENDLALKPVGAEDGMWRIGAEPWSYNSIVGDIKTDIENGGNRAFTISFTGYADKFNLSNFKNVAKQLKPYLEDGSLSIVDIDSAHSIQRNATVRIEESLPKMEAELARIDAELSDARAELESIYEKWNNR